MSQTQLMKAIALLYDELTGHLAVSVVLSHHLISELTSMELVLPKLHASSLYKTASGHKNNSLVLCVSDQL